MAHPRLMHNRDGKGVMVIVHDIVDLESLTFLPRHEIILVLSPCVPELYEALLRV